MTHKTSVDKLMSGLIGETAESPAEELFETSEESAPRRQRKRKDSQEKEFISVQIDTITLQKVRTIASIENLTLRSIVDAALKKLVAGYEEENGEIRTPNRKEKGDASSIFGI